MSFRQKLSKGGKWFVTFQALHYSFLFSWIFLKIKTEGLIGINLIEPNSFILLFELITAPISLIIVFAYILNEVLPK